MMLFVLSVSLAPAQTMFVKKEFCKKSEVELLAGNCLPDAYVIVGTSSFKRSDGINELSDLTPKQKALLRKTGRMFKSCHVFVDFKGEIMPLVDGVGKSVHLDNVAFYVLQPYFKVQEEKE